MTHIDPARIRTFVYDLLPIFTQSKCIHISILDSNSTRLRTYMLDQWNQTQEDLHLAFHITFYVFRMHRIFLVRLLLHLYLNIFMQRSLIFRVLLSLDFLHLLVSYDRYDTWNDLYDQVPKVYYTYNRNFCHRDTPWNYILVIFIQLYYTMDII